jgi:hypothetical protein
LFVSRGCSSTPFSLLEPEACGLGRFGKYFWQTVYCVSAPNCHDGSYDGRYPGNTPESEGLGSKNDGQSFGLAHAKQPEGPWGKYPNNPVFSQTGNADDFDASFLQHACPVNVGNQRRIY